MKAQISRYSHRPAQRYSGVYYKQGRMVTDADQIEQTEILKGRDEALGDDAIGDGSPAERPLLVPQGAGGWRLQEGTAYVDGVRAELRASPALDPTQPLDLYGKQTDLPFPPLLQQPGSLFLDVWERVVDDDPALLDPGLFGADTSFRTRTLCQIKTGAAALAIASLPQKGTATIENLDLIEGVVAPDPCDPCAEELELPTRVGNHLFRLELHDVQGTFEAPERLVFKWSMDNAGEHARAAAPAEMPEGFIDPIRVYEFYSEVTERRLGLFPGAAVARGAIADAYPDLPPERQDLPAAALAALPAAERAWPRVRRWDGYCVLQRQGGTLRLATDGEGRPLGRDDGRPFDLPANDDRIRIVTAAGVQRLSLRLARLAFDVVLTGRRFLAGDFWLALIREHAPEDQQLELYSAEPVGVVHHYLKLGGLDGAGVLTPEDEPAARRRFAFPKLTDLGARDVGFANACPDLYGEATTVQEALGRLCLVERQNCCTVHLRPGDDPALIDEMIPPGGHAHICFERGRFQIDGPIRIRGKGHVRVSGIGWGSEVVARKHEAALMFENCASVKVQDLSLLGGFVREGGPIQNLNGALTALDCEDVTATNVALSCQGGAGRGATCLTVRRTAAAERTRTVRVSGCNFSIGHMQIGALVINAEHVTIADNHFEARHKPKRLTFQELLKDRVRRNLLKKQIVSHLDVRGRDFNAPRNVRLQFGNRLVTFASTFPQNVWNELQQRSTSPQPGSNQELREVLDHLANRILSEAGITQNLAPIRQWLRALESRNVPVAEAGIVVAGRSLGRVAIETNTMHGVLEGIRVGLDRIAQTIGPDQVQIAGNKLRLRVPFERKRGQSGIVVTGGEQLRVEGNRIAAPVQSNGPPGVRVGKRLGPYMLITGNLSERCPICVLAQALPPKTPRFWMVERNVAIQGAVGAIATSGIQARENVP